MFETFREKTLSITERDRNFKVTHESYLEKSYECHGEVCERFSENMTYPAIPLYISEHKDEFESFFGPTVREEIHDVNQDL